MDGDQGMSNMSTTLQLFKRYKEIILSSGRLEHDDPLEFGDKTGLENLLYMCNRVLENPEWPIDKQSRWLGFIQYGLVAKRLTTVDTERDFSRPLFHKEYAHAGVEIPETSELRSQGVSN